MKQACCKRAAVRLCFCLAALPVQLFGFVRLALGFAHALVGSCYSSGKLTFLVYNRLNYVPLLRLLDRISTGLVARHWGLKARQGVIIPLYLRTPDDMLCVESRFPAGALQRLREDATAKLLLDLSGEAVLGDAWLLQLHQDLSRLGIPGERVYLLNPNTSRTFYDAWQKNASPHYRLHFLGYHFYLYAIAQKIMSDVWFGWHKHRLLAAAKRDIAEHRLRPHHFMTLNLKQRFHRTVLILFLMHKGHRDKGIITYVGEEFGEKQPENVPYEPGGEVRFILAPVMQPEEIARGYDALERARPLTYERPADTVNTIWRTPGDIAYIVPELERQHGDVQLESYFEMVTETHFNDDTMLYITEKTLRPMFRLQFFLHLGAPFVLKTLREMGFRTFSPFIDESYDEIVDAQQRMSAILAEVDRLCSMSKEELHAMYVSMWDIFEHNFRHVTTQMPALFKRDVEANILAELAKS